jgi:hypothetical protein
MALGDQGVDMLKRRALVLGTGVTIPFTVTIGDSLL